MKARFEMPHPAIVCSGPQLISVIEGLEAGTYPQPEDAIWREDLPPFLRLRLAKATGATDEQVAAIVQDAADRQTASARRRHGTAVPAGTRQSRDEVTARMMARAALQSTVQLCEALGILDAKPGRDEAEKLTRMVLIDTLCQRHPEADAAFQAWAEDDANFASSPCPAICAAAWAADYDARCQAAARDRDPRGHRNTIN